MASGKIRVGWSMMVGPRLDVAVDLFSINVIVQHRISTFSYAS